MKALGWHFTPWANGYIEMYLANIAHPYQEVRGAVADNLRTLCEQLLFPSYRSVEQFIRDSQRVYDDRAIRSLVAVDEKYEGRIDDIGRRLTEWRAERKPASEGTSDYDKASMTVLTWIWGSISEVRTSSAFPFITKLLPEFFRMQESTDNQVRCGSTLVTEESSRRADDRFRHSGAEPHGRTSPPRLRRPPVPSASRSAADETAHLAAARLAELARPPRCPSPFARRVLRLSRFLSSLLNLAAQSSTTTTSSS